MKANGRLFDNGLGVVFTDDTSKTIVTVTHDGVVQQFASAGGKLADADRDLVYRILREEGLDLFAKGTTALVQRLRGAGVAL